MGILAKEELDGITRQLKDDTYGQISFIPYMKKGEETVIYDRTNGIVYFIRGSFDECYKKVTREEFKKVIQDMLAEGWEMI